MCLWYAHHSGYGGGKAKNDTVGAVAEMEEIRKSGFLKYSRAAVRLVPDCYSKNNQQGCWDDKHFQMHGSTNLGQFEGGTYKAPYETSEKWGKAITERGGIPLTYCQTGFRSEDYAHAFPEHMLFNSSTAWMHESYKRPLDDDEFWGNAWGKSYRAWSYDCTDPGFVKHMKDVSALDRPYAETFSQYEMDILKKGTSNFDFHYLGSAKIMAEIGKGFAEALAEMMEEQKHK